MAADLNSRTLLVRQLLELAIGLEMLRFGPAVLEPSESTFSFIPPS